MDEATLKVAFTAPYTGSGQPRWCRPFRRQRRPLAWGVAVVVLLLLVVARMYYGRRIRAA